MLVAALMIAGGLGFRGSVEAAPERLPNPFFAMDTGTKDANHATPQAQVVMLKELGYAGIGYSGVSGLKEMLEALDAQGMKLYTVYVEAKIAGSVYTLPDGFREAMKLLNGRDVIIWVTVNSSVQEKAHQISDQAIVQMLQDLSNWGTASGVRIALYPHANTLVDTVYSAVRLVAETQRDNVGLTFNLCHWLMVEQGKGLETTLTKAMPFLFVVTINGADPEGGWGRLIQPLDQGMVDVEGVLRLLKKLGYKGPIGLQGYGIPGDVQENLRRSMTAWRDLSAKAAGEADDFWFEDLAGFREPTGEWLVAGDVFVDPSDEKRLAWKDGIGVVVNGPQGKTNHLLTKVEHGDVEAHVEFMVPKGSNSGVYFQGRYEIQILDSWGVQEPKYGDCGGIYQRWREGTGIEDSHRGFEGRAPRVNASREPGKWQSFDVIFRAPRFNAGGKKIANAVFVQVKHNGVIIHENQEVTGPTRAAIFNDEQSLGPIMLQGDHGPVAYRNIRLRPLTDAAAGSADKEAALDAAFAQLLKYDFGQSREALLSIERAVESTPPEQMVVMEQRLLDVLQAPEASLASRQFACKLLARAGSGRAIPVLSRWLLDEKLSHMARYALDPIPGPEVDDALLIALEKTTGGTKMGIINSLGDRHTAKAILALGALLADTDPAVGVAAAAALGKIGGEDALAQLNAAKDAAGVEVREAVARARLQCANKLLEQGKKAEALALFDALYASDAPKPVQVGAFRGRVLADGGGGARLVAEALRGEDLDFWEMALRLVREVPGASATTVFAQLAADLPSARKALLWGALADRGDTGARAAVLEAAKDPDEEVQAAALAALAPLGDASTVPLLAEAAASGKGKAREAARDSLARLRGADIDPALISGMQSASGELKTAYIQALSARQAVEAAPALLKVARKGDEVARVEALRALSNLAGAENLEALAALLVSARSDAEREAAETAVVAAALKERETSRRFAVLSGALSSAKEVPGKCAVLRVFGKVGDTQLLDAVRPALTDRTPELRDTAVRVLAAWPSADAIPDLVKVVQNSGNDVHQVIALRGLIRAVGLPSDRSASDTLALYEKALGLAKQAEEKKQVLAGVASVATLEALAMARPMLSDPDLQGEAAAAVLKIAEALAGSQSAAAKSALDDLIAASKDEKAVGQARSLLVRMRLQELQASNIASQGTASSPDGLDKDGGSGDENAAIDGNPDTYWDKADNASLYRFVVTFSDPKEISAISILGYNHHDYAPKDFDVICDGNVVQTVRNGVYTDNLLFIEFPKTECKTVELKITGYYGASPGIRELGIYTALPASAN